VNLDELSPAYVGEDRITLSLDPATDPATVGRPIAILVDYSRCDPEGTALPLDFVVQGPTKASYAEHVYRKTRPDRIIFVPKAAGEHLVVIREQRHNRWFGQLRFTIIGDVREA
jgi:hypothetical protein